MGRKEEEEEWELFFRDLIVFKENVAKAYSKAGIFAKEKVIYGTVLKPIGETEHNYFMIG